MLRLYRDFFEYSPSIIPNRELNLTDKDGDDCVFIWKF